MGENSFFFFQKRGWDRRTGGGTFFFRFLLSLSLSPSSSLPRDVLEGTPCAGESTGLSVQSAACSRIGGLVPAVVHAFCDRAASGWASGFQHCSRCGLSRRRRRRGASRLAGGRRRRFGRLSMPTFTVLEDALRLLRNRTLLHGPVRMQAMRELRGQRGFALADPDGDSAPQSERIHIKGEPQRRGAQTRSRMQVHALEMPEAVLRMLSGRNELHGGLRVQRVSQRARRDGGAAGRRHEQRPPKQRSLEQRVPQRRRVLHEGIGPLPGSIVPRATVPHLPPPLPLRRLATGRIPPVCAPKSAVRSGRKKRAVESK